MLLRILAAYSVIGLASCMSQPQAPEVEAELKGPVRGHIQYDGRPITDTTQATPSLWFRNEDTGQEATAESAIQGAQFAVSGLAFGKYGVQIAINANKENGVNGPGDYYGWTNFHVGRDGKATFKADVSRILHLLQPVDNNNDLPGWEEEGCEPGATVSQDAAFSWEPVEPDAEYSYEIRTIACPYKDLGVVTSGTTREISFRHTLLPSNPGQFYRMTLYAQRKQRRIGILMTWGPDFLAWDYRFRVR